MSETPKLTDKQKAFISWYCKVLNATEAARRAGYAGNDDTLRVVGSENLANPNIRAEIDRRLKASIPSAHEVLSRIGQTAFLDVTPYLREDNTLDVQALSDAGLGHVVVGVKPGRNGTEFTLAHPQAARKMLARYHRLLDRHVELDVTTTASLDTDTLSSLAAQIIAAQASTSNDDDT
jgi:hypothetical protein